MSGDNAPPTGEHENPDGDSAPEDEYECDYCGFTSAVKGPLVRHENACDERPDAATDATETPEDEYECDYCGFTSTVKGPLVIHENACDERPDAATDATETPADSGKTNNGKRSTTEDAAPREDPPDTVDADDAPELSDLRTEALHTLKDALNGDPDTDAVAVEAAEVIIEATED